MTGPRTRYDHNRESVAALLEHEPRFRVEQVWQGVFQRGLNPAELTSLPLPLRERLTQQLPPALTSVASARDGAFPHETSKWLWEVGGGFQVETVLMGYPRRATVCVSTQAGCAMACAFCATGQAGFDRHLSAGEVIEQIVVADREARALGRPRVDNVVFMGMGEPLANYGATMAAVRWARDDFGLSARNLTVSTVGLVPGIERLTADGTPVNLAVSLHAANDTDRDELVPINRRYQLSVLADACSRYVQHTRRRLSLEWALIAGRNDTPTAAHELADFARPLRAHVNLIPLNPTAGFTTRGSTPERVRQFRERLEELGVNVTVRANRGTRIDAACGQLRERLHATSVVVSPARKSGNERT